MSAKAAAGAGDNLLAETNLEQDMQSLFPCGLKQKPLSSKEQWACRFSALIPFIKVSRRLLMLKRSARTFQEIEHLQPLRHLAVSRVLALWFKLAGVV